MYEYEILNAATNETAIIFGFSYEDACRRWKIDSKNYKLLSAEYVD